MIESLSSARGGGSTLFEKGGTKRVKRSGGGVLVDLIDCVSVVGCIHSYSLGAPMSSFCTE